MPSAGEGVLPPLRALEDFSERDRLALTHEVLVGLAGLEPHERLPKTDRVAKAKKISSRARELSKFLDDISADESGKLWHSEFLGIFDHYSMLAALAFKARVKDGGGDAAALDDQATFDGVRFGIRFALSELLPVMLTGLASAADSWGAGEQGIDRPRGETADRRHFIRNLTRHFVIRHGKPMYQLTLDLTNYFFDDDGMEVSALYQISPVTDEMRDLHEIHKALLAAELQPKGAG